MKQQTFAGGIAGAESHPPPHPFLGRYLLRTAVALCTLTLAAGPRLRAWAGGTVIAGDQPLPVPLLAALGWLATPPVQAALGWVALASGLLLLAELLVALCGALLAEWAARRLPYSYLRVRTLRPQSRPGTVMSSPAELWRALHAAALQAERAGPGGWVACTIHAQPDEPASFGVVAAAEPTTLPALRRGVAGALLGQDAEALVEAAPDPLAAALLPGRLVVWQELRLSRPPHHPLHPPEPGAADPLGAVLAALRPPPGVLHTELQVVAQARADLQRETPWRMLAERQLWRLQRRRSSLEAQALESKLASECFDVTVRIVAVASGTDEQSAAKGAIAAVRRALGALEARGARGVQRFRATGLMGYRSAVVPKTGQRRFAGILWRAPRRRPPSRLLLPVSLWGGPMVLSCAEAGGLWHLPDVALRSLVAWLPNRHLPAPPHCFVPAGAADRVVLGHAPRGDGSLAPVGLSLRALRQVLHLTAGMGAGKSRALANMAAQLMAHGFFLLDGKGDDAGGLATAVRQLVPLRDEARLIVLDVLDAEWPIGLNPLHGIDTNAPGGMTQAIGMVLALLERLDPETWARSLGMQQYAQMATALVAEAEPEPTIGRIKQTLEDERYRAVLLPRCSNLEVRTFWETIYPRLGEQQRSSRDALLRRLDALTVDETTRYLLTLPRPTVDLLDAMERGRIVVAPLPHRTLGGIAGFVGMALLQAVIRAAFRRPGSDQTRTTVPLLVDELQVYIGQGDSQDLRDAITQLRGFGIGGVYAHQTLAQLGDLRDELLTNSANRLILRTQEPDASAYASQYPTTDLTPADIMGQHWHEHQYAVLTGGDGPPEVCSIRPLPWPEPADAEADVSLYTGPDWRTVLPPSSQERREDGACLDAVIAQMIYSATDVERVAARLAQLPDAEWSYLLARWDAIRAYQRAYILRNPGCVVPEMAPIGKREWREQRRAERQRWLSRLETRTPRLLALAAYRRQRWTNTST